MKCIIFSICLLVTALAWASPKNLIEEISEKLDSISTPPSEQLCEPSENKYSLAQKCGLALCGVPQDSPSGFLLPFSYEQYTTAEAMAEFDEIKPQIKDALEYSKKSTQALLAEAKSRIAQQEFQLTPKSDEEFDRLAYDIYAQNYYFDYDDNKSLPPLKRIKVVHLDSDKRTEKYQKGLDAYIEGEKQKMIAMPQYGMWNGLYTEEESQNLCEKKLAAIKLSAQNTPPEKLGSDFKEKILELERVYYAKTESVDLENGWGDLYHEIFYLDRDLVFRQTGDYPAYFYPCHKEECKEGVTEFISNYDFPSLISKVENGLDKLDQEIIKCQSQFAQLNLKKFQIDNIQKRTDDVKRQYQKKVMSKFSSESSKNFKKYVDEELEYAYAEAKSQTQEKKDFLDSINNDLEEFKNNRLELDDYKERLKQTSSLELVPHLLYYDDDGSINAFADNPIRSCRSYIASVLNDYFSDKNQIENNKKDYLFVSLFSSLNPSMGNQIIAHEMSHALSSQIFKNKMSEESSNKYVAFRACVSGYVNDAPPPPIERIEESFSYPDDTLYTEEDMADQLSYIFSDDKQCGDCSIMTPSYDGLSYLDNSLLAAEDDPHSSSLLRVIREALVKKMEMPDSCQRLMELYKDKFEFTPCDF